MKEEELTGRIIGRAMKVHRTLGSGFLESVYQNALVHELKKEGLALVCEVPLRVVYDGVVVGEFAADVLVEGKVIVENKAEQKLCTAHEVQLVNYLTATGIDVGLLLNFGASELEVKRKYRIFEKGSISYPVNPVNPV
jgi:GxxExxY protein